MRLSEVHGEKGLRGILLLSHPNDFLSVEAGNSGYGFQIKTLCEHVQYELSFPFVQSLSNTLILCTVVLVGAVANGGKQLKPPDYGSDFFGLVFHGGKFAQSHKIICYIVAENSVGLILELHLVEIVGLPLEFRGIIVQYVE